MDWQNLSKEECVKKLETNQNKGLSTSQVKKRLEQYGTNELTHKKKNGFFKKFISQFSDFMVIILLIAAAVSFITSLIRHDMDFIDSIIILTIVVVNALTGVIQESRAEKAIEALKKLSSPQATVLRDGKFIESGYFKDINETSIDGSFNRRYGTCRFKNFGILQSQSRGICIDRRISAG